MKERCGGTQDISGKLDTVVEQEESMENPISNLSKGVDGREGRGRYQILFVGGNEMKGSTQLRICCSSYLRNT